MIAGIEDIFIMPDWMLNGLFFLYWGLMLVLIVASARSGRDDDDV